MLQTAEEEEGDEAFYRQPKAVSKSWALVHERDFSHPDVCWRIYTRKHKPSRSSWKALTMVSYHRLWGIPQGIVLLDLLQIHREGLVGDSKGTALAVVTMRL